MPAFDDIESSEDYKRIYAKWSNRGHSNHEAVPQPKLTSFKDLNNVKAQTEAAHLGVDPGSHAMGVSAGNVPAIEDADPNEPAGAAPMINCGSEKLDKYRICRRCQGQGEYKEYIEMCAGATREMTRMCQSDIDGTPCDGGICLKNWKPKDKTKARPKKKSDITSDGKFEGKGAPSAKSLEEIAQIEETRAHNIEVALQGEEPIYKVSTQKVEEASGEEGNEDEDEEWLQVEVELPLVSTAEQIDAYVEHMRFLHVQVTWYT